MTLSPAHEPPEPRRFAGRLSPEAFEDLFRTWYPRIVSQAFLVSGGCLPLAQDAVQDAFLKCWRRMQNGEQPEVDNWPAWLRTTAVHETFSSLKKHTPAHAIDLDAYDQADAGVDLASLMDLKDAYRRVCKHIAELSSRQREVVARCAIAGQPLKEAAVIMGITEGTARAHLHRARRALDPVWVELKAMGVLDTDEGRQ